VKLASIKQCDDALVYLERYVDEGTKTYSAYSQRSETDPAYKPRSGLDSFPLVTVRIPIERVSIVEAEPDSRLKEFYVRHGEVRLAIHPETWKASDIPFLEELRALPRDEPIEVSPTASTRTVFTRQIGGLPAHFLKLHYPKRFNRKLRRLNIHNSVAVTREMKAIRHPRFAYLPDVLGVIFGEGGDAWGFLVREAAPRPPLDGGFLIPCFALYGGDLMHSDHPPLLTGLIERSGADPSAFVIDNIMIPVVECWAKAARERGLLLESHAQNTLLEVGDDYLPRRIVHRDFDVWIDFAARRRLALDTPFLGNGIADAPAEQYYSLIYDHFIGREFFDYLLKVLHGFYGVKEDAIRERVKEAFHAAFPENKNFFPEQTSFYFSDEKQPGKVVVLADTHKLPKWR
jgi:hypothetical protein